MYHDFPSHRDAEGGDKKGLAILRMIPKHGLLSLLRLRLGAIKRCPVPPEDYTVLQAILLHSARAQFQAVITGDQIERGKPAPDIYLAAARQLGVAPPHCVALEDSEAGAVAAAFIETRGIVDVRPREREPL